MLIFSGDTLAVRMKHVLLLGTGGTITAEISGNAWKPGSISVEELLSYLNIKKELKNVRLTVKELFNIDSSDMQPEFWVQIAKAIYSEIKQNDIDGVVITHGTDTMSYTASALSFLLQNLPVPIVLTGSQIPPSQPNSDARNNLLSAIRVATETNLGEVVIVFNNKIIRGNRAKKLDESGFDAFESIAVPPLGYVVDRIKLRRGYIKKGNRRKLKLYDRIETKAALIKLYPGFDPKILYKLIDMGYKGFVIEGFGAGNIPINFNSLLPWIIRAKEEKLPVVISTQCIHGHEWALLYENGKKALKMGAIPAYDMISETALVKLMWVLGITSEINKIKRLMLKPIAGEISSKASKYGA